MQKQTPIASHSLEDKEILYEIEEMQIKKVYDTKEQLNHHYSDILNHEDDFYRQAYTQLEIVCNNQIQRLDEWKQNYIDSTNMTFNGTTEIIEQQKKEANENINQRILDYIAFKAQLLMDQFPKQAAFFKNIGWKSPIMLPEKFKYPFRPETNSSSDDFKNVMFPEYDNESRNSSDVDIYTSDVFEKISNYESLNNEEIDKSYQFNDSQIENINNSETTNLFDSHHDSQNGLGINNDINFDKVFTFENSNADVIPKTENVISLEKDGHSNNHELNTIGSNNCLEIDNHSDNLELNKFESNNGLKIDDHNDNHEINEIESNNGFEKDNPSDNHELNNIESNNTLEKDNISDGHETNKTESSNGLEKDNPSENHELNKIESNNGFGSPKYFEDSIHFDDNSFDEDPFENFNKSEVIDHISSSKNEENNHGLDVNNYFSNDSNFNINSDAEKIENFGPNQDEDKNFLDSIINTPNSSAPKTDFNNTSTNNVETNDNSKSINQFESMNNFSNFNDFDSRQHPESTNIFETAVKPEPTNKPEDIKTEPIASPVGNPKIGNIFEPSNASELAKLPNPLIKSEPTNTPDLSSSSQPTSIFEPTSIFDQTSNFDLPPNLESSVAPESNEISSPTNNNEISNNFESTNDHEPTPLSDHNNISEHTNISDHANISDHPNSFEPIDSLESFHDFTAADRFGSDDNIESNKNSENSSPFDKSNEDEEKNNLENHSKEEDNEDHDLIEKNEYETNPDQPEITAKFIVGQVKIGEIIAFNLPEDLTIIGKIVSHDSDVITFVTEESEEIRIPVAQFEDSRYYFQSLD